MCIWHSSKHVLDICVFAKLRAYMEAHKTNSNTNITPCTAIILFSNDEFSICAYVCVMLVVVDMLAFDYCFGLPPHLDPPTRPTPPPPRPPPYSPPLEPFPSSIYISIWPCVILPLLNAEIKQAHPGWGTWAK